VLIYLTTIDRLKASVGLNVEQEVAVAYSEAMSLHYLEESVNSRQRTR